MTFLEAVARFEGWGADPKNRPTRNNNPGMVEFKLEHASRHGAVIETIPAGHVSTPRFACFPDPETGFKAMRETFERYYKGMTVAQAIAKWAPPHENDTEAYIRYVCNKVACDRDTLIDELL